MNLLNSLYCWFERPHRLLALWSVLRRPGAAMLDVGCGNHSASITKRHLPQCTYHGLDRQPWNVDARDEACTDAYFNVDLSRPGTLRAVPDASYDAVICSHLLEHLPDPYSITECLLSKLKPGGMIYLEVPAPHSVRLPRTARGWWGIRGCLNFYDDPTHTTLVDLPRLADLLQRRGFEVRSIRYRFLWRRVLLLPFYALAGLVLRGYVPASVLWDVTAFAQSLVARKPASPPATDAFGNHEVQNRCHAA